MTLAVLKHPLPPIVAGSDWFVDFAFLRLLAGVETPEAWTGDGFHMAFVPVTAAQAGAGFALSSAAGTIIPVAPNTPAARATAAFTAARAPGTYTALLRREAAGGEVEPLLAGLVTVYPDLAALVASGAAPGAIPTAGGGTGYRIVLNADSYRIVREGGTKGDQGLSAYEVALANGFAGSEQAWLDFLASGTETALAAAIAAGASTRAQADASLTDRLAAEETAQASTAASIASSLAVVGGVLAATSAALVAAETSLGQAVSDEAAARSSADTSLTTRLSAEEAARAQAVLDEAGVRSLADSSLAGRIDAEAAERSMAVNSLTARVSTEEATRTSADTSLTTRVSTEEATRSSAVSSLAVLAPSVAVSAATSAAASAIASITGAAPEALDTLVELAAALGDDPDFAAGVVSQTASLTARVSAEEVNRTSADTSLTTRVSAEEAARNSGDTSLTTRVSAEEAARNSGDTSLTSRISTAEAAHSAAASSLAAADGSLTTRVSAEESVRSAADTSLTSRVSTEEAARASADTSLTGRVSTAELSVSAASSTAAAASSAASSIATAYLPKVASGPYTNNRWLTINPPVDTDNPPFFWNASETVNPGDPDRPNFVVNFGHNLGAGGSEVVTGKGAIGMGFEGNYEPNPGEAYFEWHLYFVDPATGLQHRPDSMRLNKVMSDGWARLMRGNLFTWTHAQKTVPFMQMGERGIEFLGVQDGEDEPQGGVFLGTDPSDGGGVITYLRKSGSGGTGLALTSWDFINFIDGLVWENGYFFFDDGLGQGRLGNVSGAFTIVHTADVRLGTYGGDPNIVFIKASNGRVGIKTDSPEYQLDVSGSLGFTPGTSVTPAQNGDVVFELTDNGRFTVKAKGSDGTVRTRGLPLDGKVAGPPSHPGYDTGLAYLILPPGVTPAGGTQAADVEYQVLALVEERVPISGLGALVGTGVGGTNAKLALRTHPGGVLICETASPVSAASTGGVTGALAANVTLEPGWCRFCVITDGATQFNIAGQAAMHRYMGGSGVPVAASRETGWTATATYSGGFPSTAVSPTRGVVNAPAGWIVVA